MKKNFSFKSISPGSKKLAFWSENMVKRGFAWLQAKMAVLPPSSGLSDPNFAKFVVDDFLILDSRKLKVTSKVAEHIKFISALRGLLLQF